MTQSNGAAGLHPVTWSREELVPSPCTVPAPTSSQGISRYLLQPANDGPELQDKRLLQRICFIEVLFSCRIFLNFNIIIFLFLFDKYCLIIE